MHVCVCVYMYICIYVSADPPLGVIRRVKTIVSPPCFPSPYRVQPSHFCSRPSLASRLRPVFFKSRIAIRFHNPSETVLDPIWDRFWIDFGCIFGSKTGLSIIIPTKHETSLSPIKFFTSCVYMLIIRDIQKCAKTRWFLTIFEELAYAQCNDNFARKSCERQTKK